MCGIIAYLGNNVAIGILLEGLRRMEYRGYDSAGVAVIQDGKVCVSKKVGKVVNLENECKSQNYTATLGIAHTRWATHGKPSDVNSHPHLSNDLNLAIVHNGIIENHASIKKRLEAEGYTFVSETDTEVLAVLIRHVQSLEPELSLEDAVSLALSQVRGAYGLCVVDKAYPDMLVGARRGSPLILGVGDNGLLLASDATAVVGQTSKVVYLHDEDIVTCVRNGDNDFSFEIKSMKADIAMVDSGGTAAELTLGESESEAETTTTGSTGKTSRLDKNIRSKMQTRIPQTVYRALHSLTLSLEKIEKGGYEHFMLKEIMEQPTVLKDCMRGRVDTTTGQVTLGGLVDVMPKILEARRIIIVACGTSWHSATVGEYLIESLAKIPVEIEYASEFRYRNPVIFPEDVIIAISQSGETADTLEAVKIGKNAGATVIGLVNVVGSSIARETDAGAYLHVGPEIGVASTKAFTGQVLMLTMFALMLADKKELLTAEDRISYANALDQIPELIQQTLNSTNCDVVNEVAKAFRYAHNFLYLGRGPNFPVALEGALKLKEISYIHAEGYPAAEMKHGPIALIDRMMPVVIIAPKSDATYEKVKSGIEEVVARNGVVIAITEVGNDELDGLAEYVIHVPETLEILNPLLNVIPLQLLSYYIAKMRGCEIDQPRNLAKSVTVE